MSCTHDGSARMLTSGGAGCLIQAVRSGRHLSAAREPAPTHSDRPTSSWTFFQPAKRTSGEFRKEGSMPRSLSPNSNIDALRRDAKRWLKSVAAGDPEAAARFRRVFPDHAGVPKLREMQQALARQYGFPSWAALKQEIEDRGRGAADRVRLFLEKSVNRYGVDPSTRKWGDYEQDGFARGAVAARLLARHPEIAPESIHTAVAAHDLDALRALLSKDPGLVSDRCAFDGWT